MAVHNGSRHLEEQLSSLVAQTQAPELLTVWDDASSDSSLSLLERFARTAPFPVIVMSGETQRGAAASFELAIRRCDSGAIALCDQDDVWAPTKLARLSTLLDAPSHPELAVSDGRLLRDGRVAGRVWNAFGGTEPSRRDPGAAARALIAPSIPGCSLAFSASLLPVLLPFPAELGRPGSGIAHDGWIVALASAVGEVAATAEALFDYRLHPDQAIGLRGRQTRRQHIGAILRRADRGPGIDARLRAAQLVLTRLNERPHRAAIAGAHASLSQLVAHLELRNTLPAAPVTRACIVGREYRSGNYRRFSSGIGSAGMDLLSVARRS